LIFTGYPDFDASLESIRHWADGFIVKPAPPERLIETVRQQVARPRQHLRHGRERLASLLRTNKQLLIQNWLDSVEKGDLRKQVTMSESERIDHIPVLLDELIHILESKIHVVGHDSGVAYHGLHLVVDDLQEHTIQRAVQHGSMRRDSDMRLTCCFESPVWHNQ
jgi:autonomous glycyl radical cofactor GrcA